MAVRVYRVSSLSGHETLDDNGTKLNAPVFVWSSDITSKRFNIRRQPRLAASLVYTICPRISYSSSCPTARLCTKGHLDGHPETTPIR